jgi:RND family efflux transporter MFP subunit
MGLIERDRIAPVPKSLPLPVAKAAMKSLPEKAAPQPPRRASPRRAGGALVLLSIGLVLGVAADRSILAPKTEPGPRSEAGRSVAPAFSRVGRRIVVPDGSPLRTRLGMVPVEMTEVSHRLVLPAAVEADPARTVKVLTPVTGRVTDLKVQLGARVAKGQELALIDSGDLQQAYSDDEKARAQLKLTKQALDRLLILEKTSAASAKDREQAQNDYAQGQSEFERSELRLRSIGVSFEQKDEMRFLSLKAPVSGSIIDLQIAPGAVLNDATAAVMTIANLDTVWVTANVPEKDTAFVATDQAVEVDVPGLSGTDFQRQGAVRVRRARPRYAAHQGAHRLRQSQQGLQARHVRHGSFHRAPGVQACCADLRAVDDQRHDERLRRGCGLGV